MKTSITAAGETPATLTTITAMLGDLAGAIYRIRALAEATEFALEAWCTDEDEERGAMNRADTFVGLILEQVKSAVNLAEVAEDRLGRIRQANPDA